MSVLLTLLVIAIITGLIIDIFVQAETSDSAEKKPILKQKCQWITSYYPENALHGFHIHIIPENDGDHWEAEDGDCQCRTTRTEFDGGVVYQHSVMTRI